MQSFRRARAERHIGPDLKMVMIELDNQLYVALIRTSENDTNISYNIQLLPVNTGSRIGMYFVIIFTQFRTDVKSLKHVY